MNTKNIKTVPLSTIALFDFLAEVYPNEKDSGRMGKIYECLCRSYTSGKTVTAIAKQGKVDALFTWTDKVTGKRLSARLEYKIACGELEMHPAYQYVVYCPEFIPAIPVERQAFVFTRCEWENFLTGYTGRGKFLKFDEKRGKTHIQSFRSEGRPKASLPIANYIWNCCYDHPTLEEWVTKKRG